MEDFENGTLTDTFWKQHRVNTWKLWKQSTSRHFWNETDPLLGCRQVSLASKRCNEFLPSKFLPFSNCSGIVWTLAQILQPSHFSPFSKCAGIVWTQSKSCKDSMPMHAWSWWRRKSSRMSKKITKNLMIFQNFKFPLLSFFPLIIYNTWLLTIPIPNATLLWRRYPKEQNILSTHGS